MAPNAAGRAADGGRSDAEGEVRRCRENLAGGDLPHAAVHLGRALFLDPALASAYATLRDVADAAGSSDAARALFRGDGTGIPAGIAAAAIALIADDGEVSEAVRRLGAVVAAHPGKPWTAAPWFSQELASSASLISIGRAVTAVWKAVDHPAPPETAPTLAPWLALARKAAARPDIDADCLCTFSALARRLGSHQEAIAWCVEAERLEKADGRATQLTLIMLGYAHRDGGQPEQAIDAWQRATAMPPENADLLLDLTDLTYDQGDFARSLSWAERAAATDSSGAKPRGALLAARYRAGRQAHQGGDSAQLTELVDLALAHPEVSYLRNCLSRACEGFDWLQVVPPPTEAVCRSFGDLAGVEESGRERITKGTAQASTLEAPTPMSIHRTRFPQVTITVPHPREPDPRIPVTTEFGPPLWTYRGAEATATVPPPSPAAVELVHRVAGGLWAEPLVAFNRAAAFAKLEAAELLGLLAHMPPPRGPWVQVQREHPLYWQRFAQVWVCVGILHHRPEEPWARSARRTLLLRLLFGPEDWTVDAAAFALCVAAWHDPRQRAEIADALTRRYLHAAEALGRRPTELHDPLAHLVLICPGIDPQVVRLARKNLAARQKTGAVGSLLGKWRRRKDS